MLFKISFRSCWLYYAKCSKSKNKTLIRRTENWRISSPPISPVLAAPKCSNTHIVLKRKSSDNVWLSELYSILLFVWVIRLGLEPKTPTLKVLCSTCWASESILCYCYSSELRVQRYGLFLYLQTFLELFSKKIHFIHFSFIAIKISMYFRQQLPPHTISQ